PVTMATVGLRFAAHAVLDLPKLDRLIASGGHEMLAVRAKSHGAERTGVTGEGNRILPRLIQRPNAHEMIDATRCQPLAVGAVAKSADSDAVCGPSRLLLPRPGIVEPDGLIHIADCDLLVIRTKGDGRHDRTVISDGYKRLCRCRVPDHGSPI